MEWKPTDVTILFVYFWISTCFGPTGPSSGEFIQLFTQPLVQFLCRSVRVLCVLWPVLVTIALENSHQDSHNIQSMRTERHKYWTSGCVNSCTNSPEDGPVSPKHVEIQKYTNKIVTSVGFHSICWKDARYKKLKKSIILVVFWLVNLYSLFVYIEHNGDESPKKHVYIEYNRDELPKKRIHRTQRGWIT